MIKIIGIGSPFGEDNISWQVIDLLKKSPHLKNQSQPLSIEQYDRPGLRLLDLMANAQMVILIDAVVTGQPVGTLHRLQKKEIQEFKCIFSTHDLGIAQTLKIGEALNMLPQEILLYGIEIDPDNRNTDLTEVLHLAIQETAKRILQEIPD